MAQVETPTLLVACSLLSYLLGSVNLTIIASRILQIQGLTTIGSKNPGVTNLYRVAGPKIALPVLVIELLKGFLIIWVAKTWWLGELAVFLVLPFLAGNLYPLFHRFRGGRGVSAIVGTFLGVDPFITLLGGCVFIVIFGLTKRVSIGSLMMVFSYPLWSVLLDTGRFVLITAMAASVVVLFTHRFNIQRIIRGTEPRIQMNRRDDNEP